MVKPADNLVSLAELRFKPANSNDAARAVFAHHFVNVPRCSFAKDDGISQYMGSETGIGTFPDAPGVHVQLHADTPTIQSETPENSGNLRRKLLRGGFALSIFLHVAAAVAIGYVTLTLPEEPPMEDGVTSITIVVEGEADADARAAGDVEKTEEPENDPVVEPELKPVEKEPVKPIEKVADKQPEPIKQPEIQKPVQQTVEDILKDVPMPELGTDVPEILAAQQSEIKAEIAIKPMPTEEKVEPPVEKQIPVAAQPLAHPVSKPREIQTVVEKKPEQMPAEKKPEANKDEPKKKAVEKPEKKNDKPKEKPRQIKGDQGNQSNNARRGDVDSNNKGKASSNSIGESDNRQIGTAARTNYKGLVNRKLARAKGRIPSPAKGKVTVTFTITASGGVSELKVANSSGKPALDAAALQVVRAASPFPAIPADAGRKSWRMVVPMTFK